MKYSIREVGDLAGVSTRTLRYYDEIGLLKPLCISEAGYRFYGEKELALLQQILFYRERGFDLKRIQKIMYQQDFDIMQALEQHLLDLEEQREHVDLLIRTVKRTILSMKGECNMNNQEKFEVFKEKLVRENEEKYGKEIRGKYGDEEVDASNHKILNMTKEEWKNFQNLAQKINERLKEAVLSDVKPESEEGKQIVQLHKEWLQKTWKQYSTEAHAAVANMYISDERFTMYYDREVPGCAKFLEQAVRYWVNQI